MTLQEVLLLKTGGCSCLWLIVKGVVQGQDTVSQYNSSGFSLTDIKQSSLMYPKTVL